MKTLNDLFPGRMGRVELTRIAVRLRMPQLLRTNADEALADDVVAALQSALDEVRKG